VRNVSLLAEVEVNAESFFATKRGWSAHSSILRNTGAELLILHQI
jgi:hypothetical protein